MKVNGAEIFVEKLPGSGSLNFVLIHNAGGDHHFFSHQIEAYIERLEDLAPFVVSIFLETEPENRNIAESAFKSADRKSLQKIFRALLEWDAKSSGILKKIDCPALSILTDEHHCSFQKMRQEAPQFEIGKVVGSKCWATLEVPEQVNAMIARFLKITGGRNAL